MIYNKAGRNKYCITMLKKDTSFVSAEQLA